LQLSSSSLPGYNIHFPYRRGDINIHPGEGVP
jgi:hypothetical protein